MSSFCRISDLIFLGNHLNWKMEHWSPLSTEQKWHGSESTGMETKMRKSITGDCMNT